MHMHGIQIIYLNYSINNDNIIMKTCKLDNIV